MYTEYFGLNEKPFSITPDPRYLFMSDRHSEGLAYLVYGVQESSGFIQLTGEVGTGKTTLVRTLLTRIQDDVDVALVLNPQLTPVEFLAAICEELHIDLPADRNSSKALVDALNDYLLQSHSRGRRTILMIDEAQNLATEVLEQVRLLTNLETAKQKLLQIILIAQPELRDKLAQTNLRQLAQRITGRVHLEPLDREETAAYINHRMKVAGAVSDMFEDGAKREIHRLSKGVPRLINVISDRALLGAYSLEQRRVTREVVRKAAREVSGKSSKSAQITRRPVLAAAAVLALVAVLATSWWLIAGRSTSPPVESVAMLEPADKTIEPESETPTITAVNTDENPSEVAAEELPETAPVQPPQPTLDDVLRDPAINADANSAVASLLSAWGARYDPAAGDGCAQAESYGLSCTLQRGSWQMLQKLDRPAALYLMDSSGQTHRPVLIAIHGDSVDLQFQDGIRSFSSSEVANLWHGRYQLLWQPPGGDESTIRRGARGPKVAWLRNSLAAIGNGDGSAIVSSGADPDLFDADLERQLIGFQRRNRLDVDGVAGVQTQIIINSQLGLEGTPRLGGG